MSWSVLSVALGAASRQPRLAFCTVPFSFPRPQALPSHDSEDDLMAMGKARGKGKGKAPAKDGGIEYEGAKVGGASFACLLIWPSCLLAWLLA